MQLLGSYCSFAAIFCAALLLSVGLPMRAETQMQSALVQVETDQGAMFCSRVNSAWVVGSMRGMTFTSFVDQRKKLQKQLKTASSSKVATLKKKIAVLKKKNAVGMPACNAIPQESPSGSPTPLPTRSAGCFDSSRNTACFGIPAPLRGNETRGENVFKNGCMGCHSKTSDSDKRNRTYQQILNSFTNEPQMRPYSDSYSTQDVADITAYLNRYNPNQ